MSLGNAHCGMIIRCLIGTILSVAAFRLVDFEGIRCGNGTMMFRVGYEFLRILDILNAYSYSNQYYIFYYLGYKFWICEKCMILEGRNY